VRTDEEVPPKMSDGGGGLLGGTSIHVNAHQKRGTNDHSAWQTQHGDRFYVIAGG